MIICVPRAGEKGTSKFHDVRPSDELQRLHLQEIDNLFKYYNESPDMQRVRDAYGEYRWTDDAVDMKIRENIKSIFEMKNETIPFDVAFIPERRGKLDMSTYRQTMIGMRRWNASIAKPISWFEYMMRPPSGIYSKDPNLHRFNREVSSILNAERRNMSQYASTLQGISERLESLISASYSKSKNYKKSAKMLSKLNEQYWQATVNGDDGAASRIKVEIKNILDSEGAGNVMKKYVSMMEVYSREDLKKINFDAIADVDERRMTRQLTNLVIDSKDLLNEMGRVNVHGLRKAMDIVDLVFDGKSNNSNAAESAKRKIQEAIDRMEESMKADKYFPHYAIEELNKFDEALDKIDLLKVPQDNTYANRAIEQIKDALTVFTKNTLAASPDKREMFEMDPVKVLETYSQSVIAYNKKQFLTHSFLKVLKDIKPRNADFDGISKMVDYVSHKFLATQNGYIDASQTVKSASAIVARAETMSKMGLSLTGALRNSTQWFWYAVKKGYKRYYNGKKALRSTQKYYFGTDEKGNNQEMTMSQIMTDTNRTDPSGYYFDNMVNVSLEEISKGALFDTDGVRKQSIKMELDKNGDPVIVYEKNGVWKRFDKAMAKATGKSLYFHRKTENWVRKAVYENTFADYFKTMYDNDMYMTGLVDRFRTEGSKDPRAAAHKKIASDAHNMALNWVRMTQFEYSTHDRAIMYGGGVTNASVIGNSVFQFFPYASHMFEYNTRTIREGWDAMKMGDFDSYQFGAAARLIGFQVFGIGLLSILFNNNFRFIIENDTWSRMEKLYNLMTDRTSEKNFGNGLAAILTGPVVSDMLFWMEVGGITDFSRSELGELLLGYYDYHNSVSSRQDRMKVNRASVSLAKLYNSREAFAQGDVMEILRRQLLAYPSDRTEKGHEYLMNMLGVDTSRGGRRRQERQAHDAILSLPDEKREKMLSIIRDLQERSQVDRRMPPGLENLSIR